MIHGQLAIPSVCGRYEDLLVNLVWSSLSSFRSCSLLLLIPRFGYDVMTGLTAFSLKEMKHGWEKEKHFVRGQNGWNFDNYCGSNGDDHASSYCLTPYTYAASSRLELPWNTGNFSDLVIIFRLAVDISGSTVYNMVDTIKYGE
jgi:hypothetical protein